MHFQSCAHSSYLIFCYLFTFHLLFMSEFLRFCISTLFSGEITGCSVFIFFQMRSQFCRVRSCTWLPVVTSTLCGTTCRKPGNNLCVKKAAILLLAGVFAALRASGFVEEPDKNPKARKILKAASWAMHRWKIHIMHKNTVGLQAPACILPAPGCILWQRNIKHLWLIPGNPKITSQLRWHTGKEVK